MNDNLRMGSGRCIKYTGAEVVVPMFRAMPRGLPEVPGFLQEGKPITSVREAFAAARRGAGIEGFKCHDLRHTFVNNRQLEGHDYFRIMAAASHKTVTVFKRYHTVGQDALQVLVGGNWY
jgi:integrase